MIYAVTNRGEIIVYETVVRGDNIECKIRGKIVTQIFDSDIISKQNAVISLQHANNLLFAYFGDGNV